MTIKRNVLYFAITGILASLVGSYLVMGHGGHSDEAAEQLWAWETAIVTTSWATFTTLGTSDIATLSIPTYPGTILSDEYGSIFSSRGGIVSEMLVSLGDTVKKWQKVALINSPTNTPEIIALLAQKRADIAIAEWELNGAKRKIEYITTTISSPTGGIARAYDVKKQALDISYDVQKKQLDAKIASQRAQLEARWVVISSSQIASSATIAENTQKQETARKYLIGKTNEAIASLLEIFYYGDRNGLGLNTTSYDKYWGYNTNWWSLGTIDRQKITDIPERFHQNMKDILLVYPLSTEWTGADLSIILPKLENAINDANAIYALLSPGANSNYIADKTRLLGLLSGDTGIIILESKLIELTSGTRAASATASGVYSQASADLIGLEQEMKLLESERSLLEANKKKDIASLDGDQAITQVDLEKIRIDAQSAKIWAESRLTGERSALSAIQSTVRTSYAIAPFDGIISRKNIVIGQTIDVTTPLFDIAWASSAKSVFVRFEVPVSDYASISKGQSLQISLPGLDSEKTIGTIARFSSSVNKDTQTISVEATFDSSHFPIGTQVRVIKTGLSGTSFVEIPKTAIITENNESFVYKVIWGKTLKKWKMSREIIGEKTVVTEWLKSWDMIVSDATKSEWKDGMDVTNLISSNP